MSDDAPLWELDDGDRHHLALDHDGVAELDRALRQLGRTDLFPSPPQLHDADGRPIPASTVRQIVATARAQLLALLLAATGGRGLDDEQLANWAAACANLTLICAAAAGAADAAPDDELARMADVFDDQRVESEAAVLRRVRRRRDGSFRVRLRPGEAEMIRHLGGQLQRLGDSHDPVTERLFPPAYGTDTERSREFAALAHHELIDSRASAWSAALEALDQERIDADRLTALMRTVNDLRLVIGTRLDVTEDDPFLVDPDAADADLRIAYQLLGMILADIIVALRSTL